jgi:ferredoxin
MLEDTAKIFKQPVYDFEYEECIGAMKACPIKAIIQLD